MPGCPLNRRVDLFREVVITFLDARAHPQVREQLKATDSWDRSVVYHAVFSGSKQVFELVFDSIRRRVLAEEVSLEIPNACPRCQSSARSATDVI